MGEKPHLRGLQALRGIAALAVFLHHLTWPTSAILGTDHFSHRYELGAAGVLLFFALSGYIMTAWDHGSPTRFLVNRLRRIFPGLWAALLLSAGVAVFLGAPFNVDPRLLVLYPSGSLIPTYVPYWTLVFELAFYLLVFAAIVVAKGRAWLVVILCLALSYALFERPYVWTVSAFPGWSGMVFNWYSAFFLVGAVLGRLPLPKGRLIPVACAAVAALIFFGPLIGLFDYYVLAGDDGAPTLRQAFGTALALIAALSWRAEGPIGRALCRVGDASYGIYLMHIGFLFFVSYVLLRFVPGVTEWSDAVAIPIVGVAALALSYAFGAAEWAMQKRLTVAIEGMRQVRALRVATQ